MASYNQGDRPSLRNKVSGNRVYMPFWHNMVFYSQAGRLLLQRRPLGMASLHSMVSCNQGDMPLVPGFRQDNTPAAKLLQSRPAELFPEPWLPKGRLLKTQHRLPLLIRTEIFFSLLLEKRKTEISKTAHRHSRHLCGHHHCFYHRPHALRSRFIRGIRALPRRCRKGNCLAEHQVCRFSGMHRLPQRCLPITDRFQP